MSKATKRTCLTCSVKGNTHKVSTWMKKEGVYSSLPKCLSCEDKYNANIQPLKKESPKNTGCELKVDLKIKEKDSWVFYWASEPTPVDELESIKDAPDAYQGYGNEKNRGLAKTDSKGDASLSLNCPTIYKDEKKLFPRHVHYTVLKADNTWTEQIGTLEVVCKFPFDVMEDVVKLKNRVVINALPKSDYEKKHIPGSMNLHYKSLEDLSKSRVKTAVNKVIKDGYDDYPDIKKFVDDPANRSTDVPIAVYCAHDKCDASDKLVEILYSSGFMDVVLYPGGTKEWFEHSKDKDSLFDDIETDDEGDEGDIDIDIDVDDDGDEEEETIIYDGVKYLHNLETDEVMTYEDQEMVGEYDGEDVVWFNSKFYKEHLENKKEVQGEKVDKGEKGEMPKKDTDKDKDNDDDDDDDEDDEDDEKKIIVVKKDITKEEEVEEEEEEEEDEEEEEEQEISLENMSEEDETSSSDDSDDSDDEDGEYSPGNLQSQSVRELRGILKQMELKTEGRKPKLIDRIVDSQQVKQNGGSKQTHDSIYYGGGLRLSSSFRGWGFSFYK